MKTHMLLLAMGSITATCLAGEPVYSSPAPITPAPASELLGWFIAGSYGQANGVGYGVNSSDFENVNGDHARIKDLEFDVYNLQIGQEFTEDMFVYLEVGYLDGTAGATGTAFDANQSGGVFAPFDFDANIDVIPITINYKYEHTLFGPISGYITGGLGYAWTKTTMDDLDLSENGGGFYAQASAGLAWNIGPQFAIYGGARWLYLDSLDSVDLGLNNGGSINLEDSWAWEAGIRFSF